VQDLSLLLQISLYLLLLLDLGACTGPLAHVMWRLLILRIVIEVAHNLTVYIAAIGIKLQLMLKFREDVL